MAFRRVREWGCDVGTPVTSVIDRFNDLSERRARDGREIRVTSGRFSDYAPLARYHYVSGRPATCVGVLRAVDDRHGLLAGVLVVSVPTLNTRWRKRMWGERFCSGDKRRDAAAINASLRTISRVVVDPRYRGLGLATRLVRAYLARPLTEATEAVAAMGWVCPFFERAGMRAVNLGASARDVRLANILRQAGVRAWELMEVGRADEVMRSSAVVSRGVRRWMTSGARTSRKTTRRIDGVATGDTAPWRMAVLAAGSVGGRGVAYGAG